MEAEVEADDVHTRKTPHAYTAQGPDSWLTARPKAADALSAQLISEARGERLSVSPVEPSMTKTSPAAAISSLLVPIRDTDECVLRVASGQPEGTSQAS